MAKNNALSEKKGGATTVEVRCAPITGSQKTVNVKVWVVDSEQSYRYTLCDSVDSSGMRFKCHLSPVSEGIVIGADDGLGNLKSNNCATFFAPLYLKSNDFPNEPDNFKWPCYCSFVPLNKTGVKLSVSCRVASLSGRAMTVYVGNNPHQGPVHCPDLNN